MKVYGFRIKQAREILGLTQEGLAARVQFSQPHVSLVEQNAEAPSESLLHAIALATGFPVAFFTKSAGPDFPLGSLLYRKSRKIPSAETAKLRQMARAALELVVDLGRIPRFKRIPPVIPRAKCDPAEAAQHTRSALGVSPDEPISGLIQKLERAGVLVVYLPVEVEGFEAFSAWSDEEERRPVICLKKTPYGDRLRRTIAHELGHLVLHQDFLGTPRELDREANTFAAELLFPAEAMREEAIPPLTLTRLAALKKRWGVSMAAIAFDAAERGIISPRQRQYIRGKLAQRKWLEEEPVQIPVEYPRLVRQMVTAAFGADEEAVIKRLSKEIGLAKGYLSDLLGANRPQQTRLAPAGPELSATVLDFVQRSAPDPGEDLEDVMA